MLYREIIAVCSQIHTKHINTLCGQNVVFVSVKLMVHIVTSGCFKGLDRKFSALNTKRFSSFYVIEEVGNLDVRMLNESLPGDLREKFN